MFALILALGITYFVLIASENTEKKRRIRSERRYAFFIHALHRFVSFLLSLFIVSRSVFRCFRFCTLNRLTSQKLSAEIQSTQNEFHIFIHIFFARFYYYMLRNSSHCLACIRCAFIPKQFFAHSHRCYNIM